MKAILVIDEMPEQCDDCVFCQGGYSFSYLCGLTGEEFEFINGERKDFCPLKPMPQKKTPSGSDIFNDYVRGYNDCIDEILGEEK